ncbi:MAG: AbrB/MazE/SpoVT family DNA-binding domain-containing protein [Candidatus Doudnabacteria bacterium]|nr:AbrB/MazE/SpoVT family DNA-binding domain-containing protein [Candidatus Doudnabacteria bacterium]
MNTNVIVKNKHQAVIPPNLLKQVGINVGDILEAKAEGRKIVFTPKQKIDYSGFPNADDEYTPAQRRYIDARLAKSLAQTKAGLTYGPFDTADDMIAFLHEQVRKSKLKKKFKTKSK